MQHQTHISSLRGASGPRLPGQESSRPLFRPCYNPAIRIGRNILIASLAFVAFAGASDAFRVHQLASPYQSGETAIRVLLPDAFDPDNQYRVLYVLPVVAGADRRFGDPLRQVQMLGVHNTHDLICVAPEFTAPPWFADHDRSPEMRDESHFLKAVLPFIERTYPALPTAKGRLLVGFSKSGWGAFSLLLRHPQTFHKAAGWDTGIRIDTGPMGEADRAERIARIFGSRENFESYRLSNLLRDRAAALGNEPRLFYYNTGGTRAQGGAEIHQLMVELGVPHRYLFEPKRPHRWDSGWLAEAIQFLVTP